MYRRMYYSDRRRQRSFRWQRYYDKHGYGMKPGAWTRSRNRRYVNHTRYIDKRARKMRSKASREGQSRLKSYYFNRRAKGMEKRSRLRKQEYVNWRNDYKHYNARYSGSRSYGFFGE
jgi:hypothetical protein